MNATVTEIVEQINYATDFQINKRLLREKTLADLHLPYNNGLFKITPDLISFVSVWPYDDLFIEDTYQNPIKINRKEFLDLAIQHYQIQMNTWHTQYEQIKRIRKV
jgi:hypothetical protein